MQIDEYLPISHINALAYCPRRFYYEYVQAEMVLNEYVVEGRLQHAGADAGGTVWRDSLIQQRRITVWSDRLRLLGIIDVAELQAGEIIPVEYKHGRLGRWRNDHAQLCAQGLCLEERVGRTITHGYIFSFAQRRREEVIFTPELRQWTETLIDDAHRLAQLPTPPPPIAQRERCRACSLEPLCLPDEVGYLHRHAGEEHDQ